MPPRRRPQTAAAAAASSSSAAAANKVPPKKRASKLAKENDITADQEAEIQEAFALFALHHVADYEDEKEGVIRAQDVRRCLIALNTPPSSPAELSEILSTLDPGANGYVSYPHFLAVAALKLHAKHEDPDAQAEEVDAAFSLFTKGDGSDAISLAHLRRVAKELREDVDDQLLRDMIREANGGSGAVVARDDFEDVMRRAGVFA